MPKTDINTILKRGSGTEIKTIDYTSPEKMAHLKELKKKSERALKNKEVNMDRLSRLYINK